MTDDQVLNLARWGRPSRIVRSGRHQSWREVWTYDDEGAVRELAFVGGRLARIDDGREMVASSGGNGSVL